MAFLSKKKDVVESRRNVASIPRGSLYCRGCRLNGQAQYVGLFPVDGTLSGVLQVTDGSGTPAQATALPTFRIIKPDGTVATSGTGTTTQLETLTVTGCTAASPGVVTVSAAHNWVTGMRVTLASIGGITGATGDFTITVVSSTTFSLDGSTTSGTYTSGGSAKSTGRYRYTKTLTAGHGYTAGDADVVEFSYTVSSTAMVQQHFFNLV